MNAKVHKLQTDQRLQVRHVDIKTLIPYIKNSRTHSDAQVAQIAASIKEFGWTNPILVDGSNGIIAGHGRLLAARKLGQTEVPTIELSDLTETQKKAYIIAENRLALSAGWDNEMLALELGEIGDLGFDLDLTGFTAEEIGALDGVQELDGMPELPTGDKEPFQQMTFTLHDTQAEQEGAAMYVAKRMGQFIDSPNEKGNGNALARICETFLTQNGNG